MDVHQCPRCELVFASRPELTEHFELDHPALEQQDGTEPAEAEE